MRDTGKPKLLTWRWAPCAALVTGALSFCAFTLLAVPDHIGDLAPSSPGAHLSNQLSRTQPAVPSGVDWGTPTEPSGESEPAAPSPATQVASRAGVFPKRGFTPPLDRPAAPAPPPPAATPPPPAPAPEPVAAPAPVPPPPPEAAPVQADAAALAAQSSDPGH